VVFRRSFITPSAVRQGMSQVVMARKTTVILTIQSAADLVQDMYLRELKNYKPTPVKASDAEGHVQKFTMPQAPKSPEESDIQNELQAYESQQVEVEGQSSEGSAAPAEQDWFEEEEEEEEVAHGH